MDNSNTSSYDGIDIDKGLDVLRKSVFWILLIFFITNLTAYLFIRWTKPLYESSSELKLDVETNASELGLTTLGENQNLNIISGEIELIRSKLFFNKVIENFDLDISYYTIGNVLDDEKYKTSPFIVEYDLKNNSILDKKIFIDLIDEKSYRINFNNNQGEGEVHQFGQPVMTENIEFVVFATEYLDPKAFSQHYFILNSDEALIKYLENNLTVVPLNLNANTIRITLNDYNALKARDLVNAIDSIYLAYSQDEKNRENIQKINWLNNELKTIENQLEGFENYFENFTIENRTNNLDADLERTINFINEIDSQRYEITKMTANATAVLKSLENDMLEVIGEINPGQFPKFISESIENLIKLSAERDKLRLSYTESTFALTSKEQEINNIKSNLINQIKSLISKYDTDQKDLQKQKARLQKNFVELPGKSTEFNKNQRYFELYEEFYLSLMQSKAEYQIAQAGTTTQFKILSSATLGTKPISPDKLIIHGIGIVAGLVFSFFFVGIRYLLHNKISTIHELEKLSQAPILGHIPEEKEKLENTALIVDKRPKSAVSESLRSIRTNIDFMIPKTPQKVISVTSTVGGEGKTFVAVNLGAIIALSKKKVIVLDLDMRKPRVHMSFGNENPNQGISTVLINKHTYSECITHSRIEGLDYISAGPTPPNPSELLLNGEFDTLLMKLKTEYDVVILDTPPVGLVTDGILAMKKADLALYIVRTNYSQTAFMKTLNRLISVNQFKNMAVVLNALPQLRSGNYGYGYGYYDDQTNKSQSLIKKLIKK
ncbi:GumC family protein [Fulvivirga lutimaris]|uniref:GumC family protein n=1 Tax=Fulvivirga lutimaris TaxID=1819566 RepID=UPI0012BC727D|nr:tyrosine-protein kinase [Fulvivirga lutimaris]MTI38118.1 polysaccharide biosynthesis tyrosine autokinase [Fulvivirga lutimaris]